jgi:ribosomal protein S12 methylthiotransferase accessory factor
MSSNGLASGNHLTEALSHAVCELVERDANTLWHYSGERAQKLRRLDLGTVDDANCRQVLDRFENAGVDVVAWDTTSDIGICSFLCTIVDREGHAAWPMLPVSGSGCHPKRAIALLRALTEAAQGRLTLISGSRDDLAEASFNEADVRSRCDAIRESISSAIPSRSFHESADEDNNTFDADVQWELENLARAGIREVIAVNLTNPDVDIPVVRVIIPYLETMSELTGFVPGSRARKALAEAGQ